MKKLEINSKNGFINLPDLPHNCIFNKVVTGCGATTVALFNDEDYVIAVPTVELIINKTGLTEAGIAEIINPDGKKQSVFGLFGKFTEEVKNKLKEYAKMDGTKKIMCTYNKMENIDEYLNPSKFRLLVDEYHILLKSYGYRDKAVDGVLAKYNLFKSFCFMSATPISIEFTPNILKGVELVEAEWKETDVLLVKLDQTNKPYVMASNYINEFKRTGWLEINGIKSYELFFFVNSVTDIASILDYCNLSNDEVKIVCSDNDSNKKKLKGYTISNSRSASKPITFITSKSFEGVDYFSETGMCFIVSNTSNSCTLLDISTDIYQIAGRIRTESNPFRNLLVHIFNSTGKRKLNLEKSWEEMVNDTNNNIDGANEIINFINNASDDAKSMAEKMINSKYIIKNSDGKYVLRDMLVKLDLYLYKIEQVIYKSGIALRKTYNSNGIITTDVEYTKINSSIKNPNKKLSFKDAFLRYSELRDSLSVGLEADEIAKVQPLVVPAYYKLGADKVRSLRYIKKAVEEAIENADSDKSNEIRAAEYIIKKIGIGFISSKSAKTIIKEVYQLYNINKTGKASDLDNWFNCKEITKRVDGKVVKGYEIYSPKFIFK